MKIQLLHRTSSFGVQQVKSIKRQATALENVLWICLFDLDKSVNDLFISSKFLRILANNRVVNNNLFRKDEQMEENRRSRRRWSNQNRKLETFEKFSINEREEENNFERKCNDDSDRYCLQFVFEEISIVRNSNTVHTLKWPTNWRTN